MATRCASRAPIPTRKLKVTLPGPMTICDTIADAHYGRRADMAMAFAELLNEEARELEADRRRRRSSSTSPPSTSSWTTSRSGASRRCSARPSRASSCTTAVHICYGYGIEANIRWKETLGAEWRQYEEIFPALNASRIDQVSLECANSHVPLSLLGLLKDKELLVGAIDVATHAVETPEQVAARDPRRAAPRRCRAHPALHQLRHGAAAARGRGRQAQGARRRRRGWCAGSSPSLPAIAEAPAGVSGLRGHGEGRR